MLQSRRKEQVRGSYRTVFPAVFPFPKVWGQHAYALNAEPLYDLQKNVLLRKVRIGRVAVSISTIKYYKLS